MRLIDADAAIDVLNHMCSEDFDGLIVNRQKVESMLKALPPAQSKRKTGYWIEHENADIVEGYYVPMYECSCCHIWKNDNSNYCPDCGADMRGEENEID